MSHRTRTHELLEHPLRRQVVRAVRDRPGLHLQDIVDQNDASRSAVHYHVKVLVDEGVLRSERHGKYRCYFPRSIHYDERERARLAAFATPTKSRIIAYLRRHPNANQAAIAEAVDREPTTVHDHLARLDDLGLVESEPDGNAVRYVLDLEPQEREHLPDAGD